MLSYALVQHKPPILKSLTGLSKSEFDALLPSFQAAWDDYIRTQFIDPARRTKDLYLTHLKSAVSKVSVRKMPVP